MAKTSSLLDDVRATLKDRRGPATWIDLLPADLANELKSLKAQWCEGKLATTKTALGHSLAKALQARGVNIGHAGVTRWLEKP
jgi:hypothetical protein